MKRLLGNILIETDHIESVKIISDGEVVLSFVSGKTIRVSCGMPIHEAWYDGNSEQFISDLLLRDKVETEVETGSEIR